MATDANTSLIEQVNLVGVRFSRPNGLLIVFVG
jgi:hypothetical protein